MTRRAGWLVMALALGGCAVAPTVPPPTLQEPASLESWTASGRLALAANGEGGSGSFTWQQQSASTTLSIRGPLGAGAMQVTTDGEYLAVIDADGHELDSEQSQALIRRRLGADLPLAQLRYWMVGLPAPDSPASVVDAAESPRRVIEQSGWRIGYDSFGVAAGVPLPQRFTASLGGVRLKVVVDDWQVEPVSGRGP